MKKIVSLFSVALMVNTAWSQQQYQYSVNLNDVRNDEIQVELLTPSVSGSSAVFSLPKIIPGTYVIADYGKFISDVKAFDKGGKPLAVSKMNQNQWKIGGANRLHRITYRVEDIFDTKENHKVYPMAATNIEEGKNYVINTPGLFGFIEGYRDLPFRLQFAKPSQFYGSTAMPALSRSATTDVFEVKGADALYDYPLMYSVPDTTSLQVGNCKVLVSVYSPKKQIRSAEVAQWMGSLLEAARKYLGGKLPADQYAFIYYFRDSALRHSFPRGLGGALEHNTSSFYYLEEGPAQQLKQGIVDMSSHEFFHIVTPLTIASKEVKEFNFNEAVMSKHLWLYEGVTEYTAHHAQVKHGLKTVRQFLDEMASKITSSRTYYNDSLSFTELSKHSTGKWAEQYGNVYEKGALIAACLDIYLLHLSEGQYSLRNLTYDLGVRYGRNRYFNDEELFDQIAELTYPEVKDFLQRYVAGSTPIPYEQFFAYAGVQFTPRREVKGFTFGSIAMQPNEKGVVSIGQPFRPNEFGVKMGYKAGDEIYAINGMPVTAANLNEVIARVRPSMKEGEAFSVRVGRKNSAGGMDTLTLSTPAFKVTTQEPNRLAPMAAASARQQMIFKAWLTSARSNEVVETPKADAADVVSIDALIGATYHVITGPAGPRNWNRFLSLFLPEAMMGAVVNTPSGAQYRSFTPGEYQKNNAPLFTQTGFYEEELKRNVRQFGNVAIVESSYQYRLSPGGKVEQRGVNYFTLVRSNGRWWISNLIWQEEEKGLALPAELEGSKK